MGQVLGAPGIDRNAFQAKLVHDVMQERRLLGNRFHQGKFYLGEDQF